MKNLLKGHAIWKVVLAFVLVFNLFAIAATPVQASNSCDKFHYVQYGDTLYKIGVWYGVYWPDIAEANGISWPYTIYYGTNLCIPESSSDYYNYYSPGYNGSYYTSTGDVTAYVIDVNKNKNFTLKAVNLPEKEVFEVSVGKCNYATPTLVGEIRTGTSSGTFTDTYRIPNKFDGISCLIAYMDSTRTARSASVTFTNGTSGSSSDPAYDGSNLSFFVKAVKKNKTVTLRVTDFRKGEKYHIFVGKVGTGAYPYTYVGSFRQTDNKDFGITVNIPDAYRGQAKLDVRIEGITVAASQVHTFKNITY